MERDPSLDALLNTARPIPGSKTLALEVDGYHMVLRHHPARWWLDQHPDARCSWGPETPYLSTALSIARSGLDLIPDEVDGLVERGMTWSQGFFMTPRPDPSAWPPGAHAVVRAWEKHHGRAFDDLLIELEPDFAGNPPPSWAPRRSLRRIARLMVYVHETRWTPDHQRRSRT